MSPAHSALCAVVWTFSATVFTILSVETPTFASVLAAGGGWVCAALFAAQAAGGRGGDDD